MLCETPSVIRFQFRCEADHVYLRLKGQHGGSRMFPMQSSGEHRWELKVPLDPGVYHFRYYYIAPGGRLMLYHPPHEFAKKNWIENLDTVLCVSVQRSAQEREHVSDRVSVPPPSMEQPLGDPEPRLAPPTPGLFL